MADQPLTLGMLAEFHREVLLPDVKRLIEDAKTELRDEMHTGFDAVYLRLDRLDQEYQLLVHGLRRVEGRLDQLEKRFDGLERRFTSVEQEVQDLTAAVHGLEERLSRVEKRFDEALPPPTGAFLSEVAQLRNRIARLERRVRALDERVAAGPSRD